MKFLRDTRYIVIVIIALAVFLRLFMLGVNPPSLDWDEASLGYNAYSLLKTGKDEFGRPWPISIRSFEDYKPAMYTYLTIPTVAAFGLNEFAVRLPSALFGILTVLVVYALVKELIAGKHISVNMSQSALTLCIMLLLTISPWHLQFSRIAFESNIGLFFVVLGAWLFFKGLSRQRFFVFSSIAFVCSFYSYHSPRLAVPLLLLGWTVIYRKKLWKAKKMVLVSAVIGMILLVPFVREALGEGRARFSSVTVVSGGDRLNPSIERTEYDQAQGNGWVGKIFHNRRVVYAWAIAKGYVDHFDLNFLFLHGDAPDRHHAQDMGMLYVWEAPFILIGLWYVLRRRNWVLLWWFLVAPAASALTTGTPHAVRALLYLPLYQFLTAYGLGECYHFLKRQRRSLQVVGIAVFALVVWINVYFYLESYYIHSPIESSQSWQYGYKQAVAVARQYEKQVDHIVMTYAYDQPHVFVLFYDRVDPSWYQAQWLGGEVLREERGFGKYEFRRIDWPKERSKSNTLFIGTPAEIPDGAPGHVADIYFLDGSVAFRLVKT